MNIGNNRFARTAEQQGFSATLHGHAFCKCRTKIKNSTA